MRKPFFILMMLLSITSFSQTPKQKFIDGSLMIFTNNDSRFGIGAATPTFITFNITKDLRFGPALQAVAYRDFRTGQYDWNKGGLALRVDYKKLAFSYDLAMISNIETRFIGVGIRF